MVRDSFLKQILFLILVIAFLHIAAIFFYFYWSIWWYDISLHYLGGIWISLASLWYVFFSGYARVSPKNSLSIFFTVVVCALTVGVLWELFEFVAGATFSKEGYFFDTMADLVMDLAGALTGYLYFILRGYEKHLLGK